MASEAKHDTDETSTEGGVVAEKKSPVKKILMIVVPLLLLAVAGAGGAYYMGYFGKNKEIDCTKVVQGDEHYATCAEELAKAANGEGPGTFIDIPGMIVNLNSLSKQPRFLKVSMKIELVKPTDQAPFEAIRPRVIDQFQAYLRELRVEDLRGSSGMYRMKIELLNRVRAAAPAIEIKDVLFQEILIQ